jgi:uncharacterized protein
MSKSKRALIVQGGWQGHTPKESSDIIAASLKQHGFRVEISDTLDSFANARKMKGLDLVIPMWTMGEIGKEPLAGLLGAVESGVGIAGIHGGMGDAFRQATNYQFMVGGQWVAHPGGAGVTYEVNIIDQKHAITKGLKAFSVTSEQYYLHVDPGNHTLATTSFGDVVMPVAWTKMWGKGRVFYCSLGHVDETVAQPEVIELLTRGMLWAAKAPVRKAKK